MELMERSQKYKTRYFQWAMDYQLSKPTWETNDDKKIKYI